MVILNLNEKFVINLQGNRYVTYEGLLDLAHQNNLTSINVDILQIPNEENNMTAICKATATTDKGTFSDIGDASPESVNTSVIPHLIRVASTRAKARVLRDITNVGMTALEEIIEPMSDEPAEEPATDRQIDTIKKLSRKQNLNINLDSLTKKSASNIISELINKQNRKY